MPLGERLKQAGIQPKEMRTGPVWQGPCAEGPNGGITFSALSRFLQCRERFRLTMIEGLRPTPSFNHRIEYGQMWHICEEALAAQKAGTSNTSYTAPLKEYVQSLCKSHPLQQEEILKWYNVCLLQFPIYIDYWRKHEHVTKRQPLLEEKVFDVPYILPSGRVVRLRGKWDSVDLVTEGGDAGIWLMENKTKGEINESQIKRQLTGDLQTMLYLIALSEERSNPATEWGAGVSIKGVRYNVVRRPLSGGKGTIVRHKPTKSNPQGETLQHYYDRLAEYIRNEPETYFMRWSVPILQHDMACFRERTLNPVLEQLCQWYEVVRYAADTNQSPFHLEASDGERSSPVHWQHPFGVRNIMDEGGSTDLDAYLESGSEVGLQRVTELFTELK